jgi:ABC-2 type transport system permease protein
MREQLRSLWSLALILILGPTFVFVYWLWFGGGSTTYSLLIINNDAGPNGAQAIAAMQDLQYSDGQSILKVVRLTDRVEAETRLKNRTAAALVIFPVDFSHTIEVSNTVPVVLVGDLTNPQYMLAGVIASMALDGYAQSITGQPGPLQFTEEALGASGVRTEFEIYVPSVLIVAVIMLLFQTAMTVAHEVEAGTLRRLQLTRMTSFDLLGGISATQVLIGVVSVLLTFLTAQALGFHSQGPLWVAILVGAVTSLSIVGIGLVLACFARTVSEAFIYANFPLILLMFFTGAMFPIPAVPLFTLGGRTVGLFDILPPTHAVVAINKVLTLGAGLSDVLYELVMLLVLSAAYFAIGVWLFQRTHLSSR